MDLRRHGWLLPLAVLLLAGCRNDPYLAAHIESVNAEYRQLEDRLYQVEEEKDQLAANVARLEEENRRLRGGEPAPRRTPFSARPQRMAPAEPANDGLAPPMIEMGNDSIPSIEMPGEKPSPYPQPVPRDRTPNRPTPPKTNPPPEALPRRSSRVPLDGPEIELPTNKPADEADAEPTDPAPPASLPAPPAKPIEQSEPEPVDPKVTHLFLNPLLTGGDDFDRQPGDDGLSILLEPRNKADKYVPAAGAVSVVVLDPSKQGDAARVARWDFDLPTTKQKLQRVAPARGIHLQMPWPAKAPDSNKLQLFVRYETADGRKLQAEREIFVSLPGQYSHRWTPRPPDRPRREPAEVAALSKPEVGGQRSEVGGQHPPASGSPAVVGEAGKTPIAATPAARPPEKKPAEEKSPPLEAKRQRPEWRPFR